MPSPPRNYAWSYLLEATAGSLSGRSAWNAESASTPSLRNDSRIVVPLLAITAISLALIDVEFLRASQALLPMLHPATRMAALLAAQPPIATNGVLALIALMLASSRRSWDKIP